MQFRYGRLDYLGSTKEGFVRACLEKDPPINYFSFNDVLPLAQGMAEEADAFYVPPITPLAYTNLT